MELRHEGPPVQKRQRTDLRARHLVHVRNDHLCVLFISI